MATRFLVELRRLPWLGYVAALAGVALMSVVIHVALEQQRIANVSMLYLIVVLAIALAFGRSAAILVAVSAFLTFNFFFVEPVHTFTVANPAEWVALSLFLVTAVVTGQLTAAEHDRAREARQREREAVVLYDVVRLLSEPDLTEALRRVAERLRQELDLASVTVKVNPDAALAVEAHACDDGEAGQVLGSVAARAHMLSEGRAPTADRRGMPGRWIRVVSPGPPGGGRVLSRKRLLRVPVKTQDRYGGEILLVRKPGAARFRREDDRLLSAVAAQLGLVVERERLRREATEAEILRRTDELKTALLNAVSHDLRTPLSSIIASADSLQQKDVAWTEEERQEFAQAIEEEAQRLNRIVGNLLDLSRIEKGNLQPNRNWYDFGALVDDVLGRLRLVTAQHPIEPYIEDDLPPVCLDYVEIDQVLSNLIENAAKYSPTGAEIHISARRVDGNLRVAIADRGPGIPEAALKHVFEAFFRVERAEPRPRGTGLGLAVAKGLVEAHGGEISVMNRSNGGARFVFTLPLTPAPEPATHGRPETAAHDSLPFAPGKASSRSQRHDDRG